MKMRGYLLWLAALQAGTVVAAAFGLVEREAVFFVTAILVLVVALRPLAEGTALFVLSLPFFFALPFYELFDSMSSWRILLSVLFIRYLLESYCEMPPRSPIQYASSVIRQCARSRLFWTATAFLGWGMLSALAASYPVVGIKKILFFINIFLLFPVARYVVAKNGLEALLNPLRYALYTVLVVGFLQLASVFLITLEQFWRFWAGRVIPVFYGYDLGELLQTSNTWFSYAGDGPPLLRMFSVFPDSHSFAMFLMLGLAAPVALWMRRRLIERSGYAMLQSSLFVVIAVFLALIFSGSRGVWLSALVVTFLLLGALWGVGWQTWNGVYGSTAKNLIIAFLLFGILFLPASYISSLAQRAQGAKADSFASLKRAKSIADLDEVSNRSRLQIWKTALSSIVRYPALGVGPGNFSVALGEDIRGVKKGVSAHNVYLDVASEMGIPGLIAFLSLIAFVLVGIGKNTLAASPGDFHSILSAVFLVYTVWILGYSFFDVVLFNDKVLMFATVMAAVTYSKNQK